MVTVKPLGAQQIEAIARIMAETSTGLTGSQIGHLLSDCRIPDVSPDMTKWKRLYNAFISHQNQRRYANHIVMFLNRAMNPVTYTATQEVFSARRSDLNVVLAFAGMSIGDDGKVRYAGRANNLDEAMARADRLRAALASRKVHPDVLHFCRAELLHKNFFHAVFEAMKSIASKIRALSGLSADGADLVQQAFAPRGGSPPILLVNAFLTETDQGEQRGFSNLLIGLFGTIRNPLAHNPKVEWDMSEQDALDILTMASLIHRKLDRARRSPSVTAKHV